MLITIKNKVYSVPEAYNTKIQMRIEQAAQNKFMQLYPKRKGKFDAKAFSKWLEESQHSSEFEDMAFDIIFKPEGHTTPISYILNNESLTPEEMLAFGEAVDFFG